MKNIRIKILPLIIILPLALLITGTSCDKQKLSTHTVLQGKFTNSFIETGDLAAKKALAVPMFRMDYRYGYSFKIIEMIFNGTYVEKGDTLMKLDDSPIQKFIISTEEGLEKEIAAAEKLRVEFQNSIQDIESQLKAEMAGLNLKKIELERAEYETPQKQKIKKLQYKQAEIKIGKLKRQLEVKPKLNSYDQRIQDIKIAQKNVELQGSTDALRKMVITSPDKGLFQVGHNRYMYPPQNLKIGDEIRQGQLIAKIPDVTKMVVNTSVNETDFTKIKVGDQVRVRLDALPKIPFRGEITFIARSCIDKNKEKVFIVKVDIVESDLRLKPGMTVSCEFICYEGDNELFVPNECLQKENGKSYVYIDKGSTPKKVEVSSGQSNSNHTIVSGDIKPGQNLIPFEKILNQKST